ncbi:efflux transporter outer membrane subunit [Phenylobacterium sp.]|uniref:efflux transporter outer membrane subunit n=1 Tax=Phenylobacterium sp. TaxID=1871053 RepID=UPI001218B617|nr:efflux transporter outer membrane subunit [Phenylobacterium sp.]THD63860.1 MAG: efflux transporter outer membrane subunit [Phenylobacterium sp.]
MKRLTLLVGAALLAGCAGVRPPIPAEAAFTAPAAWRSPGALAGAGPDPWWTSFGDLALTRVVETALAHNDDVAIAAERVEEARSQYRLAAAERLPDLVGGGQGGRVRDVNPGFGIPEEQNFGGVTVTATWDLDLFGRLRSASRAARASLLASQDARDGVRLAVAASAAQAYLNLRALDARLGVLQDTLQARGEALRVIRRRADAGYAAQLDLRQAEAEYHSAEQLVPATQLAIRRQEDALSLLLGESPSEIPRGVALTALEPPVVPGGMPSSLLRRRPDVAAAEQQMVAADRSLDAARAAFMPRLQLSVQGGGVVADLIEQNPTGTFNLAAGLLGPIFDAGRLRAQEGIVAARRNEAAFAYRKTALSAFRDVEDALAGVRRSAEQERALVQTRDAYAAALKLATSRYRSGYAPYLDQIDAERALLSAQLTLVQARVDRLDAAVSLFQGLGGGWSKAGDAPLAAKP